MNEETVALLPCEHCGRQSAIVIPEDRVWIECADCPSKVEVGPFDTEAEAIAAWNTRAAAMGWRDIASAPRDGTMFVGWRGGVGFWHWQDGTSPSRKTGWRNYMWVYPENEGPTHWQPLPTPPEQTT